MTDTTNTEPPLPDADYACHYPPHELVCSLADVAGYGNDRAAHAVAQIKAREITDAEIDALVTARPDLAQAIHHDIIPMGAFVELVRAAIALANKGG